MIWLNIKLATHVFDDNYIFITTLFTLYIIEFCFRLFLIYLWMYWLYLYLIHVNLYHVHMYILLISANDVLFFLLSRVDLWCYFVSLPGSPVWIPVTSVWCFFSRRRLFLHLPASGGTSLGVSLDSAGTHFRLMRSTGSRMLLASCVISGHGTVLRCGCLSAPTR